MAQQQILLRSPPVNRRHSSPTITGDVTAEKAASPSREAKKKRRGEMAGGAAAECAAVCCCCPFTIMEFLYLALYRLPCGLCRKIYRKSALGRKKKRQQRMTMKKKRGSRPQQHDEDVAIVGANANDAEIGIGTNNGGGAVETPAAVDPEEEEKMWDRFYGTGFWRSPSQRESLSLWCHDSGPSPES